MLNLRMVTGPLTKAENETILEQYNRLTSSRIPITEFLRWVQDGPAGPAQHAILETDHGDIVGHHSLLPLKAAPGDGQSTPSKSEYTFLRDEFRSTRVRGFENSGKPTWLLLLDQHFRHGCANGLGPILISTGTAYHRFIASIGAQRLEVPLWECLLVLRPWNAAQKTPNLDPWQRASLGAVGTLQRTVWSVASLLSPSSSEYPPIPIDSGTIPSSNGVVNFFDDPGFLRWRYPDGQYERLALDKEGSEYVIVKTGSPSRYVRVCQWRMNSGEPTFSLIDRMLRMAKQEHALGLRWSFYGNDTAALEFVRRARRLGFLCARRVRTLLVYPKEQLPAAEKWRLTDAMFSFDP